MIHQAVIGMCFGDEGKGRVVDQICLANGSPANLVVRFSGGQQAAHHVVLPDGTDHVFSSFGSGTLRGCPTYISKFCTVDPVGILVELEVLKGLSIPDPILYIDRKCPVTTIFDKICNIQTDIQNRHGSCRVGVGSTWEREKKMYSLLAEDLNHPTVLDLKVKEISKYYGGRTEGSQLFVERCKKLIDCSNIRIIDGIESIQSGYDSIVYEGSQGLLLDQNIGFFPHVTRTNTGLTNVLKLHPQLDTVYYVTRAYQTRHGNGPMTNTGYPHRIKPNPFECNYANDGQGDFRISPLDLDLLKYGLDKDRYQNGGDHKEVLVVTCLDLIGDYYYFTQNGNFVSFDSEDSFIDNIASVLGFTQDIYTSNSPSTFLKLHREGA